MNPKLAKFLNSRFAFLFLMTLTLCSSTYLLFVKSPHQGLGDDGIYIAAGERIFMGQSIYTNGFRSGSLGAAIFWFLHNSLSFLPTWILFQSIYLICVVALVFLLNRNSEPNVNLLISLCCLWASPVREMLHNHQITSLVILLAMWPFYSQSKFIGKEVLSILSLALALDLKPQISLVTVLALAMLFQRYQMLFRAVLLLAFSHIIISITRHELVDISWFDTVSGIKGSTPWGESIFLWPLLDTLIFPDFLLYTMAIFSILLTFIFVTMKARAGNSYAVLNLLAVWVYLLNYAHYYDLILIVVLVMIAVIRAPNFAHLLAFAYILLPSEFFVPKNFISWLVVFSMFSAFIAIASKVRVRLFLLVLLSNVGLHVIVESFNTVTQDQEVRIRSGILVLLFLLGLLKQPLDRFPISSQS